MEKLIYLTWKPDSLPIEDYRAHLLDEVSPRLVAAAWRFLTTEGTQALAPVLGDFGQDAVRMPQPDDAEASDRLRHALKVFLIDADRRVRNIYCTGFLDERIVLNDMRTLLTEDR